MTARWRRAKCSTLPRFMPENARIFRTPGGVYNARPAHQPRETDASYPARAACRCLFYVLFCALAARRARRRAAYRAVRPVAVPGATAPAARRLALCPRPPRQRPLLGVYQPLSLRRRAATVRHPRQRVAGAVSRPLSAARRLADAPLERARKLAPHPAHSAPLDGRRTRPRLFVHRFSLARRRLQRAAHAAGRPRAYRRRFSRQFRADSCRQPARPRRRAAAGQTAGDCRRPVCCCQRHQPAGTHHAQRHAFQRRPHSGQHRTKHQIRSGADGAPPARLHRARPRARRSGHHPAGNGVYLHGRANDARLGAAGRLFQGTRADAGQRYSGGRPEKTAFLQRHHHPRRRQRPLLQTPPAALWRIRAAAQLAEHL